MRILEKTSTRLVIGDIRQPRFFQILGNIGVCFLIGIPGALAHVVIRDTGVVTLKCDRVAPQQINCDRTKSRYLDLRPGLETTTIVQVQAAEVLDADQVRLRPADGAWVPIIRHTPTDNQPELEAIAAQVNAFLTSSQPSLTVVYDDRWNPIILGPLGVLLLPFWILALYMLYTSNQSKVIELDRTRNEVILKTWTVLGIRTRAVPLDTVQGICLKLCTSSEGDNYYSSTLLTTSRRYGLNNYYVKYAKEEAYDLQRAVQQFLQLPIPTDSD